MNPITPTFVSLATPRPTHCNTKPLRQYLLPPLKYFTDGAVWQLGYLIACQYFTDSEFANVAPICVATGILCGLNEFIFSGTSLRYDEQLQEASGKDILKLAFSYSLASAFTAGLWQYWLNLASTQSSSPAAQLFCTGLLAAMSFITILSALRTAFHYFAAPPLNAQNLTGWNKKNLQKDLQATLYSGLAAACFVLTDRDSHNPIYISPENNRLSGKSGWLLGLLQAACATLMGYMISQLLLFVFSKSVTLCQRNNLKPTHNPLFTVSPTGTMASPATPDTPRRGSGAGVMLAVQRSQSSLRNMRVDGSGAHVTVA
jgi:hypothetical protein